MLKYLGWALQAIGVLALIGVSFVAWRLFFPSTVSRSPAFVLNWTGLDPGQRVDVIYSNESQNHWMGDYSSIYCLHIERFEPTSLMAGWWLQGTETSDILAKARRDAAQEQIGKCFGRALDPNSPDLAAFIWRVNLFGRDQVEGADVIFYDQATSRLLYTGFQN